jgi:hypothetical protein
LLFCDLSLTPLFTGTQAASEAPPLAVPVQRVVGCRFSLARIQHPNPAGSGAARSSGTQYLAQCGWVALFLQKDLFGASPIFQDIVSD